MIKIGLFGFGCVGQGLYDVLDKSKGIKANIVKICVKDKSKKRSLAAENFTFDKEAILNNPDINLVVELIDNADDAYEIVKTALISGKNVVTANKKMLAHHLGELIGLQKQHNVALLYEASACGSIPIIRNLEEYYDNELLYSVSGIFNGSSNYILSKVFNENSAYDTALKKAQELGFAETDPTLDVGGFDALYKLVIITAHTYGIIVRPEAVFNYGIQSLSEHDIRYAREKGLKIKLVAQVRKLSEEHITLFVIPQLVKADEHLYNVENEYNGVVVEALFSDKQFFYGKGAGGHPTGSAVLSDISASTYNYQYEYKKQRQKNGLSYSTDVELELYVRYEKEADLEYFNLENITERYYGNGYHYVIGTVKLATLLKIKEALVDLKVFIASTGKQVRYDKQKISTAEKEEGKKALSGVI